MDACRERGIYWVHVGSGCIYEGDNGGKGFSEDDPSNFTKSFYSRTKIWADQALSECCDSQDGKGGILLLRLRMPFDGTEGERNLITKITKYERVLDSQNSLTYLPDFFQAAKTLIEKRKTGVYNIVNPGSTSPYEIVKRYKEIVDPQHQFERLSMEQLSEVACTGRSNCVLSTQKLASEGITLRPVDEAIEEALFQIASNRKE
jgi:dTDP-4-dehydrorhamnose reductase